MTYQERSSAGRTGLPGLKPYVSGGTGKDIYHDVTGYLEDVRKQRAAKSPEHAALVAEYERRHEESAPDLGPGPEWYRERAAGNEDDLQGLAPLLTGGVIRGRDAVLEH